MPLGSWTAKQVDDRAPERGSYKIESQDRHSPSLALPLQERLYTGTLNGFVCVGHLYCDFFKHLDGELFRLQWKWPF